MWGLCGTKILDLCVKEGTIHLLSPMLVQTMILRGSHNGMNVDNTTPEEIAALVDAYKKIRPKEVMLYSIDRKTPEQALVKVDKEELERIAEIIRAEGIKVLVS